MLTKQKMETTTKLPQPIGHFDVTHCSFRRSHLAPEKWRNPGRDQVYEVFVPP